MSFFGTLSLFINQKEKTMVEALDAERCDAIMATVMEKPSEKLAEECKNTKEKIINISVNFFLEGKADPRSLIVTGRFRESFPEAVKFIMNIYSQEVSSMLQKIDNPFDTIQTVVTISIEGNEVFRESKTFDQLGLSVQAS